MYLSSLNAQADDHPEPDALLRQEMEQFQNQIREYIISLIVFIVLYICSAALIEFYRRKNEDDDEDDGALPTTDAVFRYRTTSTSSATSRVGNGATSNDYDEDVVVHRISIVLCKFSVAVSCGAVFLLPISIFGNEILFRFPDSYYVKWLNLSLLHTLWNLVFVLSNLSLFGLMPFAWFFTEAEGFVGSRRGLWSRFKETFVVLFILFVLMFGVATVFLAIFADDDDAKASLLDAWDIYFPRLYSCVSLLGVLILLICTPLGFARIFTVVGQLVVKPRFLRDLDNEVAIVRFEEESLKRKKRESDKRRSRGGGGGGGGEQHPSPARVTLFEPNLSLESPQHHHHHQPPPAPSSLTRLTNHYCQSPPDMNQSYDHLHIPNGAHTDFYRARSPFSPPVGNQYQSMDGHGSVPETQNKHTCNGSKSDYQIAYCAATTRLRGAVSDTRVAGVPRNGYYGSSSSSYKSSPKYGVKRNGMKEGLHCDVSIEGESKMSAEEIDSRLSQVKEERQALEKQQAKPKWQRNLVYPVIMLALLILTSLSVLMVFANVFELVMGYKALPGDGAMRNLGSSSSSSFFGSIGSVTQVVVIFYVMGASIVGLHSAPGIRSITPKPHDTPLTSIIANATLILILSSAQPLLARTLGLSNFDLLGDYREIRWLRHFYIVLLYNFLFAGATAWCLLKKITGPVRQELYVRLGSAFNPTNKYANPVSWMYFVKLPTYPFSASKNKQV